MIHLFTDYGVQGPYIGQVNSALKSLCPEEQVIELMSDVPRNNPKAGAYLLASLVGHLPKDCIVFAVVDPGVGSGKDKPVVVHADNRAYVGSENGLFDMVIQQATAYVMHQIDWIPENLSYSFHGRDLYAPVCAMLANGEKPDMHPVSWSNIRNWPKLLHEIIYIDGFGNAMTGLSGDYLDKSVQIRINQHVVSQADTFASVSANSLFWYKNSNGLVEIAANQANAAEILSLEIGSDLSIVAYS